MSLGLRVYRMLLGLYPRAFRERFGGEMAQCAAELLRQSPTPSARCRAWTRLLLDLPPSLIREHRAGRVTPSASHQRENMTTLLQDFRYAIRGLRRAPGFSLVVVLSLMIGVGANTLIYTVVDGLILRPFAYPEPDRLVAVAASFPKLGAEQSAIEVLSPAEFADIQGGTQSLERFSVFDLGNRSISGGDRPERVFSAFVWGDPFVTVGLEPALGRGFVPEETYREGPAEAVLSWRIWKSRFAGDSSLIGKTIRVNGSPTTVIGIMPPSLLLLGTDLWLPLGFDPKDMPRDRRQYSILARLRPGATLAAANAELATIAERVESANVAEREEYTGWSLVALPWATATLGQLRPAGIALIAAVALVLLIACANVASLMLVRGASREHELAIRHALGAAGSRLVRQLLTESVILVAIGTVAGILWARVMLRPIVGLFPDMINTLALEPSLNVRVLGFTLVVSILTAIVVGIFPAWRFGRRPGSIAGGETSRVSAGPGRIRLRQVFTVVQVALALILLAGAGVMLRSISELQDVRPGIGIENVLTMRISLPSQKYSMPAIAPFFENLADRVREIPGVEAAGAATQFPPANAFSSRLWRETVPGDEGSPVDVSNVTARYFETLGYQLVAGRGVASTDLENSPRVAVLNQAAALKFFPGSNPVGQRIRLGRDRNGPEWREVVGVVSDAHNRGLANPVEPEIFVPVRQQDVASNNQLFLLVRTRANPLGVLPEVRSTIASIDPDQPIYLIHTLKEAFADSIATRRAAMLLMIGFAEIAVLLASVGIYGLLSYLVSQRTHEIGIRIALGADLGSVRAMVLRQTLILVGSGTLIGLAGALAGSRLLERLVYQVKPGDPLTLVVVAGILGLVGVAAAIGPAHRATSVSPLEALRSDG